ncbi:MAG: phosphoenolpyruvate carboxykinase [Planctomycetes bacterium DG_58]|nr:MAG: phosphoenolpyruvate carboxykinase [Planctomycetes bacterium DG_58]
MPERYEQTLRARLTREHLEKLLQLENVKLHRFVADAIELCQPASVFVCTDAPEDIAHIRKKAVETGEEKPLAIEGHTIHFDGPTDQGRAKEVTRYLVEPTEDLGANINAMDRDEGLAEVRRYLAGSMQGKEMLVRFFSLGPVNSVFAICGVQLTDSFYVAHSEDLLYRSGYEQFKSHPTARDYISVLHSAGRLENGVSADVDKKRIYIDLTDEVVYSVNTQYAGNTVGFKKLALRLAIRKADRDNWLSEHMLVMGINGPGGRRTYFTGAFPSGCGKTSTAMVPGETIVGDDIAYLRRIDGEVRAVNVECGIFGIIRDVNPTDDPLIWDVLTKPGEVIFSNVLVKDGIPYWEGGGREIPDDGVNYTGRWHRGKKDARGDEIHPSHWNARYTIRLKGLANLDEHADDPRGVPIRGIVYGGRDADTSVPVQQSFDWAHGVITMGAGLESETTAATMEQAGVRKFQPMSNLDFVSIPLGRYVQNHLDFIQDLKQPPLIFAVNYFLKHEDGRFLTGINDKHVWVKWMELRANADVGCIHVPTGRIPLYEDLARLFKQVLDREYPRDAYVSQFTLRVRENLDKIDRIETIWRTEVADTPEVLFQILREQRERLLEAQARHGDYVSPFEFSTAG